MTTDHLDIHRETIERSKRGHAKAQRELYHLYAKAMYNICMRMMNTREEAEDMLQESFSEAFHRLDTFRYDSTFGAWLKKIMINKCINELKRKKTDLEFFDDMSPFEHQDDKPEQYMPGLSVNSIHAAMEQLPEGSRVIFSLYLLEGYNHKEIADILNINESTSKSQYMRAKIKVKEILKTQIHEN